MVALASTTGSSKSSGQDLPKWAYQLVRLGSSFARLNQNNRTDLVVLLVPTRAFVAVFLAAGMVLEDLLTRIRSTEEHFDWLCSLPQGTILENERRQGTILGVDRSTAATRLKIAIGDGRHRTNISSFVCHPSMEKWLPKNSLRPKPGSLAQRLAGHLIDSSERWFVSAETHPTVVLCGERKALFAEIDTPLLGSGERSGEDSLETLLLANEYQYQRERRRTRIKSRRSRAHDFEDPTEHLVIYDGGRAFINRSQDFRGTNQLLVLEFGDTDLSETLELVDSIWLDRVDDKDQHAIRLPSPPPGCEMAHFQVLA